MEEDKKYVCEKQKIGEMFEIECTPEEPKEGRKPTKLYCVYGTKGKSGGGSIIGVGGQYGKQQIDFECFTEDDLAKKVAKSLKTKKQNIKWREKE